MWLIALLLGLLACSARADPLEGFGATTPGGSGGAPYTVTSLADSGPGTLRDALSQSNRNVTFAVGGTVTLTSTLRFTGHHLTVDGSTSPEPGISIAAGPVVAGALLDLKTCHDVILRHVRIMDNPDPDTGDNLRIWDGAYNVVVDHCSFRRPGDGNLDISDGAHDVTVQWCILAEAYKNSLIRTDVSNLSLHHNLYVHGDERNPQLDDATFVDMVNCVVYDWAGNYGTRIRNGASANIVNCVYLPGDGSDPEDAIVIYDSPGPVYLSGNILPPECEVEGTTTMRLPAPAVTEMEAGAALVAVVVGAGAWPRDAEDAAYAGAVSSVQACATWGSIKALYQ